MLQKTEHIYGKLRSSWKIWHLWIRPKWSGLEVVCQKPAKLPANFGRKNALGDFNAGETSMPQYRSRPCGGGSEDVLPYTVNSR